MNILFICDEYPPGLNGGIGSIIQSLSRTLVSLGHKVFVAGLYSYEYGGNDYEEDNGVKVWRLKYGFNYLNIKFIYKIQRKLPNRIKDLLYGKRNLRNFNLFIQDLIIKEQIDIIEQSDWLTFAYELGIQNPVLPSLSIPVVLKLHGSHTFFSNELSIPLNPYYAAVDNAFFSRADALAAVSNYTTQKNKRLFNTERLITTLYNGIEIPEKKQSHKRSEQLIFFSGTLTKKKGVFSLMLAWNIVIEKHPAATLVIFGKGPIAPLKALLDKHTIDSVLFMGHQPKAVLIEYLSKAMIAVFPSFSETFGLAAVEAMSVGCPTIFTKLSCGPEIITDNFDGILTDPTDIPGIAASICLLLENDALRKQIGIEGEKSARKRFEIKTVAQQHIKFYENSISRFKNNDF